MVISDGRGTDLGIGLMDAAYGTLVTNVDFGAGEGRPPPLPAHLPHLLIAYRHLPPPPPLTLFTMPACTRLSKRL
jgi:hypothetical protein